MNMNPLKSITGTLLTGLVLAIAIGFAYKGFGLQAIGLVVWIHVFVGIIWIGLLYYFNFVQMPAAAQAAADSEGPGPAAINKYIAPRALLWFRWSALVTWLSGAAILEINRYGLMKTLFFQHGDNSLAIAIGIGGWLGTIMLFNVWVLIWPNQKKILGLVEASDEQKASAKLIATMASRTNTLLSVPMLMCMTSFGHGGFPI